MADTGSGQYEAGKWAERTAQGKRLFIRGFFMTGDMIPGWRLAKAVPGPEAAGGKAGSYMWRSRNEKVEELVRFDFLEGDSWRDIQTKLLEQLGRDYQASRLDEAGKRKLEIGDVALVGFGRVVQALVFTRANMLVRIHSVGKKSVAVAEFARRMDDLFLKKPVQTEEKVVPNIEVFKAEKKSVKVNEKVAITFQGSDPLKRPVWYRLAADRGEFHAENDKVYYFAESPGKSELQLHVVNENGCAAEAVLSMAVE